MILTYFFREPAAWGIPLLIQAVSYMLILRKMGKMPLKGIIPILGEMEMSRDLFRRRRSFWRPAIVAGVLMITAWYLSSNTEISLYLRVTAAIVYGVFLIRLYWRLAGQFGRGVLFRIGLILVPSVFLLILALGRSKYLGPIEFPPDKPRSRTATFLRKAAVGIISLAELGALVGGCFLLTIIFHPARPIAEYMLQEDLAKMSSVTESDELVTRADTMGAGYEAVVDAQRSRGYYFPDHSNDSKVVVMEYIIGADLEDNHGSASINIAQMKDATAKGDGLDFVVQAGGSKRWFTKGIKDESVGRYLVSGGELTEAQALDDSLCMSEPENLRDFIVWTKENYPADRYMLVLWDHGGGFAYGYGSDILNSRKDGKNGLSASEIIKAVKASGVKFDVIGFDACLMQDLEYANAFESCADYYLCSEETEPAYGWFYTAGFGKLAEDPTISTEEFGGMMVSSYDQLYRKMHDGEPVPGNTLSLVDLTLVRPVYKQLMGLYKDSTAKIKDDHSIFANLSVARSRAYVFYDGEQVDLVSFLTGLKKADYKQRVASDEKLDKMIEAAKACVVCSNKDAAEGINGIAIDFTYSSLSDYNHEYEQLKAVNYKTEEKFFNNFCSVMASQQMQQDTEAGGWREILSYDYSKEKWYVEGYDNYDTAKLFIDIPVKEVEGGYLPELPEKTWDTVLDCATSAYVPMPDTGKLMYIGREHFDDMDADGHFKVVVENKWAHIGNNLVCYNSEEEVESDAGITYKGTIRARLNGEEDVTLQVEWDPVAKDTEEPHTGHIVGYRPDEEKLHILPKGLEELKTGDTLEFLFDIYDEEGKLEGTETVGDKVIVVKQENLTVTDEPFAPGTDIECYGILTDVYQRELMTEVIKKSF